MEIKRSYIQWLQALLLVVLIGVTIWTKLTSPKIAFVNSSVIVEKYLGLVEVRKAFEQKTKEWGAELETLGQRYKEASDYLSNNRSKLSAAEIQRLEKDLLRKLDEFNSHKSDIERRGEEENEKMTQGALNQVNSYVETYSKTHNIDIVIGVTISGNVLYGSERVDITNEILEGLNKSYR